MEELLKNFDLKPQDIPMIILGSIFFLVLWKTFSKVLFAPVLTLLEERERQTSGATHSAQEVRAEASKMRATITEKLTESRAKAHHAKLEIINKVQREASAEILKAEQEGQEIVRKTRWNLAETGNSLRTQALKEVEIMADLVLRKVTSSPTTTEQVH